jgi:hypothetical protein
VQIVLVSVTAITIKVPMKSWPSKITKITNPFLPLKFYWEPRVYKSLYSVINTFLFHGTSGAARKRPR